MALNPDGNHPVFPTRPDGTRDVDGLRDLKDTWRDMEALVKKGDRWTSHHVEVWGTLTEGHFRQS